jgi:WD40 repeat protein
MSLFSLLTRRQGLVRLAGALGCLGVLAGRAGGKDTALIQALKGELRAMAFSPDGKLLATVGGSLPFNKGAAFGEVMLFDVDTGKERAALAGHKGMVEAVAFSPDGKRLATGGNFGHPVAGLGPPLIIWDMATLKEVARPTVGTVRALAFSPDGKALAVADFKTIRLLETRRFKEEWAMKAAGVWCLAWAPDGKALFSGGSDGNLRRWDATTGRQTLRVRQEGAVRSLAFAPDGKTLAIAAGKFITLWDPKREVERMVRQAHKADVESLAFAQDGELLLSVASRDEVSLRMWTVLTMNAFASQKAQGNCLASSRRGDIAIGGWMRGNLMLLRGKKK